MVHSPADALLVDMGAYEFDPLVGECPAATLVDVYPADGGPPPRPRLCTCDAEPPPPGAPEGEGEGVDAGMFGAGFARYLTFVDLENRAEAEYFPLLVERLTQVARAVFDEEQRHEIACALLDPQLVFVGPAVAAQVPQIAAPLDP